MTGELCLEEEPGRETTTHKGFVGGENVVGPSLTQKEFGRLLVDHTTDYLYKKRTGTLQPEDIALHEALAAEAFAEETTD